MQTQLNTNTLRAAITAKASYLLLVFSLLVFSIFFNQKSYAQNGVLISLTTGTANASGHGRIVILVNQLVNMIKQQINFHLPQCARVENNELRCLLPTALNRQGKSVHLVHLYRAGCIKQAHPLKSASVHQTNSAHSVQYARAYYIQSTHLVHLFSAVHSKSNFSQTLNKKH